MERTAAVSGTKEWSVASVNCVDGCSHACRYCYARAMAARFGRIRFDDWPEMHVRDKDVQANRRFHDGGRVMFPTASDITPEVWPACMTVIGKLLAAGNDLLIVSKPHPECIRAICYEFSEYWNKILFRFSIGARENDLLSYWEPGAPSYEERKRCLIFAAQAGFSTSVSAEPLLDADDAVGLFRDLEPWVTDTIWFGKMNRIPSDCASPAAIEAIKRGQTNERIREIYEALKYEPKVRWKESYKEVLGLKRATEAGMDR